MSLSRILIVDDDQDLTDGLKKGIENHGFSVDTYNDPRKALDMFKPGMYDLLLVDINMPQMNGFELYREVKKRDADARVCFITAFEVYHDEFKRMFPTVKVQCFIKKPLTISELVLRIETELNNSQ